MVRGLVPFATRTPSLFDNFRREMDDLMSQFFGNDGSQELQQWFAPRVNLAETETGYEVSVDLPGLKPEEVNVEFRDGALWITGERKLEQEDKGKTWHRVERHFGQFRRVIPLEGMVKADQIEAEYKDGVLRLSVPKHESSQPKRITVKT